MVPINGRPIIHWLISYLRKSGFSRIILGIRDGETRLPKFVSQAFGRVLKIEFVTVGQDLGPGYTMLRCLEHLETHEPCLVVLGDTLFEFPTNYATSKSQNFVLTNPVEDAPRWCLAKVSKSGKIAKLADKPASNPDNWPALVGVYHLHNPAPARQALQAAVATGCRSLQLRHALEPYVSSETLHAYPAGQWLDCGNLDFLTSSRRRLLQARSFNTVQIDDLHGTITKRSEHTSKFLNEINYYRLVPGDLATFFPRLVDFSLAPGNRFLTLEYYGYPTLSEIWTFEELGETYWRAVFEALKRIMSCFEVYSAQISPASTFNFYWQKTVERLESFRGQSKTFAGLLAAKKISLNGISLSGWPMLQKEIEKRVRRLSSKPQGRIIHGDLCFPNILYDPLSRLFKFIDPRGSFGDSGIYGDGRYDVAKLLHSLDGGYDFLIHDMFALQQNGQSIRLEQFFPPSRSAVLREFEKVFSSNYDITEVRILEGLLFLSMCPLHSDHPSRQVAMFATGLRILNEVLNNEDMY
jgi:dTDP-glucose pyrophosphorylase